MSRSLLLPWTVSRPMPDYRALLAVDAKDFTRLPAMLHAPMSQVIPALVDRALTAAGLGDLKNAKSFPANTGDGVVFGFPPRLLPRALWPFLDVLDRELGRFNARSSGPLIRLRACLHVGPLPDSGMAGDGNGTTRNDAHRLLDSEAVRKALAQGTEEATHLAAIISHRVYEDVIQGGYTALHPDRCTEVSATVEGKSFDQRAWIYVPSPSGDLLRPAGAAPDEDGARAPLPKAVDDALPAPEARGNSQHVSSGVALMGNVTGGFSYSAGSGSGLEREK